jgi:hypothetical protein
LGFEGLIGAVLWRSHSSVSRQSAPCSPQWRENFLVARIPPPSPLSLWLRYDRSLPWCQRTLPTHTLWYQSRTMPFHIFWSIYHWLLSFCAIDPLGWYLVCRKILISNCFPYSLLLNSRVNKLIYRTGTSILYSFKQHFIDWFDLFYDKIFSISSNVLLKWAVRHRGCGRKMWKQWSNWRLGLSLFCTTTVFLLKSDRIHRV